MLRIPHALVVVASAVLASAASAAEPAPSVDLCGVLRRQWSQEYAESGKAEELRGWQVRKDKLGELSARASGILSEAAGALSEDERGLIQLLRGGQYDDFKRVFGKVKSRLAPLRDKHNQASCYPGKLPSKPRIELIYADPACQMRCERQAEESLAALATLKLESPFAAEKKSLDEKRDALTHAKIALEEGLGNSRAQLEAIKAAEPGDWDPAKEESLTQKVKETDAKRAELDKQLDQVHKRALELIDLSIAPLRAGKAPREILPPDEANAAFHKSLAGCMNGKSSIQSGNACDRALVAYEPGSSPQMEAQLSQLAFEERFVASCWPGAGMNEDNPKVRAFTSLTYKVVDGQVRLEACAMHRDTGLPDRVCARVGWEHLGLGGGVASREFQILAPESPKPQSEAEYLAERAAKTPGLICPSAKATGIGAAGDAKLPHPVSFISTDAAKAGENAPASPTGAQPTIRAGGAL